MLNAWAPNFFAINTYSIMEIYLFRKEKKLWIKFGNMR